LAFFDIVGSGRFDARESTVFFKNGTEFAILTDDMTLQPETLVSYERRKGYADAVIQLLCAAADHRGAYIEMIAEPFQRDGVPLGPTREELIAWYARYGFLPHSSGIAGALRREPDKGKLNTNEDALNCGRAACGGT
jgi:hypothetical protein